MPKVSKTKTVTKKTKTQGPKVDRSAASVSVQERRVSLVKTLRKMGATSMVAARSIEEVAEKLGYTHHDVYCLCFHQYPLVTGGFVKTSKEVEGISGLAVYLTAKGAKSDFSEAPFVRSSNPKVKGSKPKKSSGSKSKPKKSSGSKSAKGKSTKAKAKARSAKSPGVDDGDNSSQTPVNDSPAVAASEV